MIRRPPRSTQGVSSAASDVYKRQCRGRQVSCSYAGRKTAAHHSGVCGFPYEHLHQIVSPGSRLGGRPSAPDGRKKRPRNKLPGPQNRCQPALQRTRHRAQQLRCTPESIHPTGPSARHQERAVRLLGKRRITHRRGRDLHAVRARACLLYTSPSPRDLSTSRMPSSA